MRWHGRRRRRISRRTVESEIPSSSATTFGSNNRRADGFGYSSSRRTIAGPAFLIGHQRIAAAMAASVADQAELRRGAVASASAKRLHVGLRLLPQTTLQRPLQAHPALACQPYDWPPGWRMAGWIPNELSGAVVALGEWLAGLVHNSAALKGIPDLATGDLHPPTGMTP